MFALSSAESESLDDVDVFSELSDVDVFSESDAGFGVVFLEGVFWVVLETRAVGAAGSFAFVLELGFLEFDLAGVAELVDLAVVFFAELGDEFEVSVLEWAVLAGLVDLTGIVFAELGFEVSVLELLLFLFW